MARLTLRENGQERIIKTTDEQITIGRAADNLITLDDSKSSRNHAVIKIGDEGATLIDLESSNGTKLNGQPVKQQLLKEGDEIQIGRAVIVFSYAIEEEEEDAQVLEGIEEEDTATRRAIRFRRSLRNRPGRLSRPRTPMPGPAPVSAAKPVEPKSILSETNRNSDTIYESKGARPPGETKVEPPKPEPPKPAPVQSEGRTIVKKFYLVDQGKVRLFTRETATTSPLPLATVFSDSAEAVPWDEIFKLEGAAPESGFDGARASFLFAHRDGDAQGDGSIILVDTAAVVTVIETADESNPKATSAFTGKAINLAATVATEWSAESLQKEFDAYCAKNGRLGTDHLRQRLGKHPQPDYWKKVESNLQAGRIRVIFLIREPTVAIQKVIDFLHGKTSMAAYALQLDLYMERGAERPRTAFAGKILEPSKGSRVPKGGAQPKATSEPNPALDVVSM
jgi:pSer/pThr/pTyr-binding forkhead associated (FHA) protein